MVPGQGDCGGAAAGAAAGGAAGPASAPEVKATAARAAASGPGSTTAQTQPSRVRPRGTARVGAGAGTAVGAAQCPRSTRSRVAAQLLVLARLAPPATAAPPVRLAELVQFLAGARPSDRAVRAWLGQHGLAAAVRAAPAGAGLSSGLQSLFTPGHQLSPWQSRRLGWSVELTSDFAAARHLARNLDPYDANILSVFQGLVPPSAGSWPTPRPSIVSLQRAVAGSRRGAGQSGQLGQAAQLDQAAAFLGGLGYFVARLEGAPCPPHHSLP